MVKSEYVSRDQTSFCHDHHLGDRRKAGNRNAIQEAAGVPGDSLQWMGARDTVVPGIYAARICRRKRVTPCRYQGRAYPIERLFNGKTVMPVDYAIPTILHPVVPSVSLRRSEKQYGEEAIKVYTSSFASMYSCDPHRQLAKPQTNLREFEEEPLLDIPWTWVWELDEMIRMRCYQDGVLFDATVAIHQLDRREFVTMRYPRKVCLTKPFSSFLFLMDIIEAP